MSQQRRDWISLTQCKESWVGVTLGSLLQVHEVSISSGSGMLFLFVTRQYRVVNIFYGAEWHCRELTTLFVKYIVLLTVSNMISWRDGEMRGRYLKCIALSQRIFSETRSSYSDSDLGDDLSAPVYFFSLSTCFQGVLHKTESLKAWCNFHIFSVPLAFCSVGSMKDTLRVEEWMNLLDSVSALKLGLYCTLLQYFTWNPGKHELMAEGCSPWLAWLQI